MAMVHARASSSRMTWPHAEVARSRGQEAGREQGCQAAIARQGICKRGGRVDSKPRSPPNRRQVEGQPEPAQGRPAGVAAGCEPDPQPCRSRPARWQARAATAGVRRRPQLRLTGSSGLRSASTPAADRLPAPGRVRKGQRQALQRAHRQVGPGFGLRGIAVEAGISADDDLAPGRRRRPQIADDMRVLAAAAADDPQLRRCRQVRRPTRRIARGGDGGKRARAVGKSSPSRSASVKSLRSSDFGPGLAKNGFSR